MPGFDAVNQFIKRGQAFYYADAKNQDFKMATMSINASDSAIGRTIQQAIDAYTARDQLYMFYNDQPPNQEEFKQRAHSKGLMNFNEKQGFWMIHSAPNFNDPTSGSYIYPPTSMRFGQAFFCATFLSDQLEEISRQIFVSHFGVYQKNLPDSLAKKYPRLYHILKMDETVDEKTCPYFRNSALKTKAGQWLMSYEKNKLASSDLYANQIAEDKKASFFVETWLNGSPADWKNYKCDGNFVKNIRAIKHADGVEWKSELDHSKWAVSDKPKTVCIGDINRQASQRNRGGGTLCIDNEKVWKFFKDSIKTVECCEKEKGSCEPMPTDVPSEDVPPRNRKFGDPKILKPE